MTDAVFEYRCRRCGAIEDSLRSDQATLTEADHLAQQCTQCESSLVDDESGDEDLFMDGYYDAYEDEGQLDGDYEDDDR
jgi:DNA-directed RNA polymerase subunit RPC12/RpoP